LTVFPVPCERMLICYTACVDFSTRIF